MGKSSSRGRHSRGIGQTVADGYFIVSRSVNRRTIQEGYDEIFTSKFSSCGRGRCRLAGRVALRLGAILSVAAGAHHLRLCPRRRFWSDHPHHDQWFSERLGQPVIFETKLGAGGNIAAQTVINSAADGYTLLFVPTASAINATLYERLPFNFLRDITPVAGLVQMPNLMTVNPSVPAKTVAEFIAYAKTNPGRINMASPGIGTMTIWRASCFR